MDASAFDPRPGNVEDRRNEFNPWQQLLMKLGVPPIDHTGLPPGQFNSFDLTLDPVESVGPLAGQLGAVDLINRQISNLDTQIAEMKRKRGGP